MAFIDFAPSIAAGTIGAATAIIATQIANKNAKHREGRNREADENRERLRDLRMVTDDATIAQWLNVNGELPAVCGEHSCYTAGWNGP